MVAGENRNYGLVTGALHARKDSVRRAPSIFPADQLLARAAAIRRDMGTACNDENYLYGVMRLTSLDSTYLSHTPAATSWPDSRPRTNWPKHLRRVLTSAWYLHRFVPSPLLRRRRTSYLSYVSLITAGGAIPNNFPIGFSIQWTMKRRAAKEFSNIEAELID